MKGSGRHKLCYIASLALGALGWIGVAHLLHELKIITAIAASVFIKWHS